MTHDSDWQKSLQGALESRGLRLTRQRLLISKIFFEHEGHANIEDLYRKARKAYPKLGYATVYRTLNLLKECGLASTMHFGDGITRFEPSRHHHDHLICTECGKIVEFENEEIERLQDAVAAEHHFVLAHHKMELYGTCPTCTKKLTASA